MSLPARSDPDAASPRRRVVPWCVAALAVVWVIWGTQPSRLIGDTLDSRLATVYALAHDGTFVIETPGQLVTNPFASRTVDKVEFHGRIVSSKPPVVPLLMTLEYVAMRSMLGWNLDHPEDKDPISRVMSLSLVGLPFVVMVWVVVCAVQREFGGTAVPLFLGVAAIFGTQAGAFAVTFNNHVPAAAAVVVGLVVTLEILRRGPQTPRGAYVVFGLAAGAAVTIDVPTVVFPAFFGMAIARSHWRALLMWAVPFAAIPVVAQSIALYVASGSILPAQLHPGAYLYENSYWRNPLGVDATNDPFWTYLFHITIGRVGVFSLFPVTALGVVGLVSMRGASRSFQVTMALAAAASIILALYYARSTNNYGGSAFGFRWFIVLGPVFLLMAAPAVARIRRPWVWAIPILLLMASAYSMWVGAREPWTPNREWTVRIFGPTV